MPEASHSIPGPSGVDGTGQQDAPSGPNGAPPVAGNPRSAQPPPETSQANGAGDDQNGRAGSSVPQAEAEAKAIDCRRDAPYKQVSVTFLYDDNTYRQDKYGNPTLTTPARPVASSSTLNSKSKRAGSKQPENPSSRNSKRSDPASLSLRRVATTHQGQEEEDDFRILEDGEAKWTANHWHVDEQGGSNRSTPSVQTEGSASRRTATPGSARPTPPPPTKEQPPLARLHCVDFFPLGQPDIDEVRREVEELVRQYFYRRPNYGEILENGMTLQPTRSEAELEREIGLKLGIGPYPDKGPRTDVVLGEYGWYKYIGQLGEEAKGSPIHKAVKGFERMVRGWEGCFAVCGGQRVTVGRLVPTKGITLLWAFDIKDEEFYHVTWSYDETTNQPVIAAAGATGLIYILSPAEKQMRRVLKGHGGSILSVKFSPNEPHILASASSDKTVRLWNIFGEDVDDPNTHIPPPAKDPEEKPSRQSVRPTTSGTAAEGLDENAEPPVAVKAEPTGARKQPGYNLLASYENLSERYAKTGGAYSGPDPAEDTLSRAYALAQADEGNACYAILAGEGLGGHRWDATAVAFHPQHRAVVTAGHDYTIRIWALPESPEIPKAGDRKRTPLGHHPQLVSFPLFATNRIHEGGIDCIEWLTDDILISKTAASVVVWQWLGYRRFFTEGQYETNRLPQMTDWKNSHSFRIVAKYHFHVGSLWYKRFGVHHAWGDQDENVNPNVRNPKTLIACVDGEYDPPRVLVFEPDNILQQEKLVPPRFINNDIWHGVDCDECEEEPSNEVETQVDGGSTDGPVLPSSPIPMPMEYPIKIDDSPDNRATKELSEEEDDDSDNYFPTLRAWILDTQSLPSLKQTAAKSYGKPVDSTTTHLECVAVSPRGARWILAVGQAGAIVAFESKAARKEDEEWTDGSEVSDMSHVSVSDDDDDTEEDIELEGA